MKIKTMTLGLFSVNNYLVYCEETSRAILIDACEDARTILSTIEQLQLTLVYLINTHGHADHIAGNTEILQAAGATLMIHEIEAPYLSDPNLNLGALMGQNLTSPPADRYLKEGDVVELDDISLKVLHTPGHSPGHISLIGDGFAFVGDVIFRQSIGRTDFPGGSHEQLIETISTKIYSLPDDTILYNGHGPATTVGEEKKWNPFVRGE